MAAASTYLELKLLDAVLKNTTYTAGANVYVGLVNIGTPTDADTTMAGKEIGAGVGYARQGSQIAKWTNVGGSPSHYDNTDAITFGPCSTTNWGTVTHVFISDSGTWNAGNMLLWAALASSKTVLVGDSLTFAAHELDIYLE